MEPKSNKELAINATLEYVNSLNSSGHAQIIDAQKFIDILKMFYDAISLLDEH